MKRVFIIGNSRFPRGSALANYLQYLMLSIQDGGFETILIGDTNSEYIQDGNKKQSYMNFSIIPFQISTNKFIRHYQYKNGFSNERIKALKCEGINKDDIVILLTHNSIFCKKLLHFRKKIGFKVIVGILEFFDRENFSGTDKQYRDYINTIDKILPRFDMILPISTFIEEYFKKKGCSTFCLPIMADCQEYDFCQKSYDKYRFVLPANGKMKDDLSSMLKGFSLLNQNELEKIEIHICGVKEERVKEKLTEDEYLKILPMLTIHKWMKYEELVKLYQKMHFLILAREESQMTKANFPSKIPETMGYGIVPICSVVGDYTKYYLRDGIDSIHIQGSTPIVCCEAIRRAIAFSMNQYDTMSRSARETVETRFDYRVWTSKIKEVLESI